MNEKNPADIMSSLSYFADAIVSNPKGAMELLTEFEKTIPGQKPWDSNLLQGVRALAKAVNKNLNNPQPIKEAIKNLKSSSNPNKRNAAHALGWALSLPRSKF